MLYRLRNELNYAWFTYRTREINAGVPIPCDPDAPCQVHTMLGARDLPLYLVAIRSLLRWFPGVAVIVHSDGTLNREICERIARHVPGVRLIEPEEADQRAGEALRDRPALLRWRSHDAAYRRLFDTELSSTAPKRIIMDADVLVLGKPHELIRWIQSGTTPVLLGQPADERAPDAPPPKPSAHVQEHFRHKVPQLAAATGWPARFLQGTTAGFYACTNELTLDRIETLLGVCESLGLPMTQWGGDQCVVIYLLSAAGGGRLDEARCFNFDPSRVAACDNAEIIHFYGTYRFYSGVYPALASRVCGELRRAAAGR